MRRPYRVASACLVVAGIGGCAGGDLDEAVRQEIEALVASSEAPSYARAASWRLVRQVYGDHDDRPLWSRAGRPLGRARELVASICRAGREGLRPAAYDLEGLRDAVRALKQKERPGPKDIAALDIRLTAMMLALGNDLLAGQLDPRTVDDGWYLRARRSSVDSILRAAFREEGFPDLLESLRPQQKEYHELVEALSDYREMLRQGGWPSVPAGQGAPPRRSGRAGRGVAGAAPDHGGPRRARRTRSRSTTRR